VARRGKIFVIWQRLPLARAITAADQVALQVVQRHGFFACVRRSLVSGDEGPWVNPHPSRGALKRASESGHRFLRPFRAPNYRNTYPGFRRRLHPGLGYSPAPLRGSRTTPPGKLPYRCEKSKLLQYEGGSSASHRGSGARCSLSLSFARNLIFLGCRFLAPGVSHALKPSLAYDTKCFEAVVGISPLESGRSLF
jgi:hypothetical protein